MLVGGLNALQTMTIVSSLPFAIVLLLAIVGLTKALWVEAFKHDSQLIMTLPHSGHDKNDNWQGRLKNIEDYPNKANVNKFILSTVVPALNAVVQELNKNQINATLSDEGGHCIIVEHGAQQEFIYRVVARKYSQPDFALDLDDHEDEQAQSYYRAEVHLGEGGQDYDIMGWSKTSAFSTYVAIVNNKNSLELW